MSKTLSDFFCGPLFDFTNVPGAHVPLSMQDEANLQNLMNDTSDDYAALCEKANNLCDLYAFEQARAARVASAPAIASAPGMYRNPANGVIFRVKMNEAGTGLYAFVLRGESWTYVGGLAKNGILESFRMSVAECDKYSVTLGYCCRCDRPLTNLKSLGFGMGPICRKKQAAGK